MRYTKIDGINGVDISIFYKKNDEGFEVWIIADTTKGKILCSHFINTKNPETFLKYYADAELTWIEKESIDKFDVKTGYLESQETPEYSKYTDSQIFLNGMSDIPLDRKAWNKVKKQIIGRWKNKITEFELCERGGYIYVQSGENSYIKLTKAATEWDLQPWSLLLRDARGTGLAIGIKRCNEEQLHLSSFNNDFIVEVFSRVRA